MSGPSGASLLPTDLTSHLAFPRAAVLNRIGESIDRGVELLKARAIGPVAFNTFRANRSKWDDHNRDLLRRVFKTDAVRIAYEKSGIVPTGAASPALEMDRLLASVEDKLKTLQAIVDRLGGTETIAAGTGTGLSAGVKSKIFVAHAGETGLARTVGRYLESEHFSPILVSGAPAEGEIDANQIDAYPDARFAIVLVAGDQVDGSSRRAPNPDAIMWLGYFAGRLGRRRVCGLIQPGLDPPGRYLGLKSVPFDDAGAWKGLLAKRIELADQDGE